MATVSTKEQDFLECDEALRGQSHVCLSFLCPEDILDDKQVFFLSKFLSTVSKDVELMFVALKDRYPADTELIEQIRSQHSYLSKEEDLQEQFRLFSKSPSLEDEFHAKNQFKTTIRGVKVRGVYGSEGEARARVEKLRRKDPRHNIYVAEVGAWLPFADNPDELKDAEYAETGLNTLMKCYRENLDKTQQHFDSRIAEVREEFGAPSSGAEEASTVFAAVLEDKNDAWLESRISSVENA
jgi:hypothetical protein